MSKTKAATVTESEYVKSAREALETMGVQFATKFLLHGKHFGDDAASRDVFDVTFSRGSKTFTIQFGQSLRDSTTDGQNPPTTYDVLACLTKDAPGTFEDFCGEYGYDTDSRKAESVWKACRREYRKVSTFFTKAEMEIIREIQ